MSNRLSLFSSMSGMQKSFSTVEESKKSINKQAYELVRGAKGQDLETVKAEFKVKKDAIEKRLTAVRKNNNLPEKIKQRQERRAEQELEALDYEYSDKIKLATSRAKSAERGERGKTREEQAISSAEKLEVLNPLVVPIKASSETGPGQLTFSQMLANTSRDIDVNDPGSEELIEFRDSINSINGSVRNILKVFRKKVNLKNPVFNNSFIKTNVMQDDVTVSRTEISSDAIKLFWLYLGGDEVFNRAKNREAFVKALTKLEGKNKKSVTKPIADATSTEDLITNGDVKTVFGYLKSFITEDPDAPKAIKDSLTSNVNNIITAPDAIYSGFSMTTSENVADSIYYSIISAFGSNEDKTLLLKRNGTIGANGLQGATNRFLSKEATDALALRVKQLTSEQEDFKALPSSGRQVDWGIGVRNVNKTYEKYRGGKVLSAVGGKFLKLVNLDDIEKEEVKSIIGEIFSGISSPLKSENVNTKEEIESLKLKIRGLSTPSTKDIEEKIKTILHDNGASEAEVREINDGKSPEKASQLRTQAIKELGEEKDEAVKSLAALENQKKSDVAPSKEDIRSLFLSGTENPEFLSKLKEVFISRLNIITKSMEVRINTLQKQATIEPTKKENLASKTKTLENIKSTVSEVVYTILDSFNSLSPVDLEQIASLFIASENHPGKTNKLKETTNLKPLHAWVEDLIGALVKYETQVPGTINKDEHEEALENKIKSIQTSIAQVNSDLQTSEQDSDELLKSELVTLSTQFSAAQVELDNYKKELEKAGVVAKSAGNARQAGILTTMLKKELANDKIDPYNLQSIVSKIPSDVFRYTKPSLLKTAQDLLETLTTREDVPDTEWKIRVRKALYTFAHYSNSAEFSTEGAVSRKKALATISAPFVSELEDTSEYSNPSLEKFEEYDDEKAQQEKITDLKKHLKKLERANKPTIRIKKALKRHEKLNKKILSGLSILPSTALRGEAIIISDTALNSVLLNNAKKLESNARVFYNSILEMIKDLDITEQLAGPDKLFSQDNAEFVSRVLQLVANYKQNLSTGDSSTELEDTLFLDKLIDTNKVSLSNTATPEGENQKNIMAELTDDVIKAALLGHDSFKTFMAILNQSVEDNTIWYEKKIVNAPIIAGLGLKSATLLNIMSGIKNFTSIENFDLSLNKRNKNVLSELLNINNYPNAFTSYSSTSLMMKLFFLSQLKKAVTGANVIGSFTGDFISVNLKVEDPDKITESILTNTKRLNKVFEKSVLEEFKADFGEGGTLDQELSETSDLLWEIAENTGGILYSIDLKTGAAVSIPVTKESLMNTVIEQGKNCLGLFISSLSKKDPALEGLLALFDRAREEDLITQLKNTISIVKTGINFWVGYEAMKTISQQQLYDEDTKETNVAELSNRLDTFKKQAKFVAFVSPFITEQDVLKSEDGKTVKLATFTTTKVNQAVKGGFKNLNDSFLSVFIKDFIWEAIKNPLSKLEKQEVKKTDTDTVIETEKTKKETKSKQNREIENQFDVFFSGVFKKRPNAQEDNILDIESPEAQKKLTQKFSRDLKKTEAMLATGKPGNFAPISIIPHTDEKTGETTLGLVLDIMKDTGYQNLVGNTDKQLQAEDISFGQEVTTFSNGLQAVVDVLSRVYSTQDDIELTKELQAYSNSVAASVPMVVAASSAIINGVYDTDSQRAALAELQKIPANVPPSVNEVEELTSPATAYNKALKSFTDKESPYYTIYEFAEAAGKAMAANKKLTTADILQAINDALKDPSKLASVSVPKSFDQMSDTEIASEHLLTKEEIEKYSNLLFTRLFGHDNEKEGKTQEQESQEIITNILRSIQKSLGSLKVNDTKDSREEAYERDIKRLEAKKADTQKAVEALKQKISVISTALGEEEALNMPTEIVAPNLPQNTSTNPYANLSPEQAVTKAKQNIDQAYSNIPTASLPKPNDFTKTTIPTIKPKEDKEEEFPDPAWGWLTGKKPVSEGVENIPGVDKNEPLLDALQRHKVSLFKKQQEIIDINAEIVEIQKALAGQTNKRSEVAMIVFLANLYKKATKAYTKVKDKIDKVNIYKIQASLYNFEFIPIQQATKAIVAFVESLKATSNSDLVDDILDKFKAFETSYIKTFTQPKPSKQETISDSISVRALNAFNRLLEAEEQATSTMGDDGHSEGTDIKNLINPEPEVPITDQDFILSMAKYLKTVEHVNRAEDWKVFGDKPGETFDGVKTAIQQACMVQFIGETNGSSVFQDLKKSLRSKVSLGFTIKTEDPSIREPLYLQFTKLNDIARVANNDELFIMEILHPEQLED